MNKSQHGFVTSRTHAILVSARTVLILVLLGYLSGCTAVYKSTGDILVNYGRAEMTPYLMQGSDLGMACATGEAMTPFLVSFESVNSNPTRLAVLTNSMAALCAQQRALEHELDYLRAIRRGRSEVARDSRILQKRYSAQAATRLYESYQRAQKQYPAIRNGQCPRLRSEFDQMVYMVGMLNGIQALVYDTVADNSLALPRNIPANVARAVECLDDNQWWGVPGAIRHTVWAILPMLAPAGTDPWPALRQADQIGRRAGVRLSAALYAMAAYSVGDQQELRHAIHGFPQPADELDPRYRMLNAVSAFTVQTLSDRLWTEATGNRTPFGALGTLPDDQQQTSDESIEDLLRY